MAFKWLFRKNFQELKEDIINEIDKRLPQKSLAAEPAEPVQKYAPAPTNFMVEDGDEPKVKPSDLIHKAILSNNTLTVITQPEGHLFTNTKADKGLYESAIQARTVEELKAIMIGELTEEDRKNMSDMDKNREIMKSVPQLLETGDFEQRDSSLYMKGINLTVPAVMIKAFAEVLGNQEAYSALKNFWYWLAVNPNPESREDLYRFIEYNDIKITPRGLLVLYRRIVSRGRKEKPWVSLVSGEYTKIKLKKKSPKNYYVIAHIDGEYSSYRVVPAGAPIEDEEEVVGSVYDLYQSLGEAVENDYTAWHDKKMNIKIGSVYSIDEEEVDRNNAYACSSGLHVASKNYDYSGFGDTAVLCLVNPSKVRAVPAAENGKMRVSEMFIVSVLEVDEHGKYMDEDVDLVPLDEEYFNIGVEELEQMAKSVNIEELKKNNLLPAVSFDSFNHITEHLRSTVGKRVQLV